MSRILVAHDAHAASVVARHDPAHPMASRLAELEALATDAHEVVRTLLSLGHDADRVPVGRDGGAFARIERERPDLVLDLCDTLAGRGDLAVAVPAFCDLVGVRFAGATSRGKALGRRKHDVKAALCRAGVPTPRFQILDTAAQVDAFTLALEPPVIVKPSGEHASVGISQASLAWDRDAVVARARWLFAHDLGPVLVEEYVDGTEVDVLVAGHPPQAFAAARYDFSSLPEGHPRVCTFDLKWFRDPVLSDARAPDPRWRGPLPTRTPAAPVLTTELPAIARAAFEAGGCRDWGRIDFRVDGSGLPFVIDVTPNPYLAPLSSAAESAAAAGVGYPELLTLLIEGALARQSP